MAGAVFGVSLGFHPRKDHMIRNRADPQLRGGPNIERAWASATSQAPTALGIDRRVVQLEVVIEG
jgi:hypothetical protein